MLFLFQLPFLLLIIVLGTYSVQRRITISGQYVNERNSHEWTSDLLYDASKTRTYGKFVGIFLLEIDN